MNDNKRTEQITYFSLDAYYMNYIQAIPKDDAFNLLEKLRNGEKYAVQQEWIQSMNDDAELKDLFLSSLFLTYWKHPESRTRIIDFTKNELCSNSSFRTLDEITLTLILHFAAYDAAFVDLTIAILEKCEFNPNKYVQGYHLLAWCILADSPEMLELLLRKGANANAPAMRGNWVTPTRLYVNPDISTSLIGMMMDSHSVIQKSVLKRPLYSGLPEYPMTLSNFFTVRERAHGIELVNQLYRNGCNIAYVGEDFVMLVHLLGARNMEDTRNNKLYAEQKNWKELYKHIQLLEEKEVARLSTQLRRETKGTMRLPYIFAQKQDQQTTNY